jgi:hypothetical protein
MIETTTKQARRGEEGESSCLPAYAKEAESSGKVEHVKKCSTNLPAWASEAKIA